MALFFGGIIARLLFVVAIKLEFWNDVIIELMMKGTDVILTLLGATFGIEILGLVCMGISSIVELTTHPPRQKRRAVRDALRDTLRRASDARQPTEVK